MTSMTTSEAVTILLTPENIEKHGGILETLMYAEAHKHELPIDQFRAYFKLKQGFQQMFATKESNDE